MTVSIEADKCIGCALCVDNIPEIFSMDGFIAVAATSEIAQKHHDELRATAQDCPSEAIILSGPKLSLYEPPR